MSILVPRNTISFDDVRPRDDKRFQSEVRNTATVIEHDDLQVCSVIEEIQK